MSNFSVPDLVSVEGALPGREADRIERLVLKVMGIEFAAVAGTCLVTSVIYFRAALEHWPPAGEYVTAAVLIAAFVLLSALSLKQYAAIQTQSRDRYMWTGMGAVTLGFAVFLSFLFIFKVADWYSRGTFFCQLLAVSAVILIARGGTHNFIRRAIRTGAVEARRAVLVGDARAHADILKDLRRFGVRWAGVLRPPSLHANAVARVERSAANVVAFVERCRSLRPDDVILPTAPADLSRTALIVDALSALPVTVHVIPTGMDGLWASARMAHLGRATTIQVLRPPLSDFELTVKRAFDICVAGLGVIALSPLLLVVSAAIRLDSRGPVLFRQNRHGYNNETIPVVKFRTMTTMEDGETASTYTQAKGNDARITRLGRILRRTNIDELPQLFNVLRGEMSIVGPRPHPIALNTRFRDRIAPFSRRHNVKPGLTGWAQVHGFRGETDTIEKMRLRVEHDLYYIENWSFTLDVKIVLMTLFSKSAYQNAY